MRKSLQKQERFNASKSLICSLQRCIPRRVRVDGDETLQNCFSGLYLNFSYHSWLLPWLGSHCQGSFARSLPIAC